MGLCEGVVWHGMVVESSSTWREGWVGGFASGTEYMQNICTYGGACIQLVEARAVG